MAMLDAAGLRDFLDTRFPQVAAQFAVDAAGEGTVTLRLIADGSHLRPGGTVSGPAIFALADVGAWLAVLTLIGPVEMAVTTNCGIDFMRAAPGGQDLCCEGRVLKLGRRMAVTDAFIRPQGGGALVARAGLTYAIPPGVIVPPAAAVGVS